MYWKAKLFLFKKKKGCSAWLLVVFLLTVELTAYGDNTV